MRTTALFCTLAASLTLGACKTASPSNNDSDAKGISDLFKKTQKANASLAPSKFTIPLAYDKSSLSLQQALVSLLCRGQNQSGFAPENATGVDKSPANSATLSSQSNNLHELLITVPSALNAEVKAEQLNNPPCTASFVINLVPQTGGGYWQIYAGVPANSDGKVTQAALADLLAKTQVVNFDPSTLGEAQSSYKLCADKQDASCPWSVSRVYR